MSEPVAVYDLPVRRVRLVLVSAAMVAVVLFFALPYVDALAFIARVRLG